MNLRMRCVAVFLCWIGSTSAHAADTIEYVHTDALGSPVAITDVNRNVIERSEYEPYGALLNRPPKDGPGYTGHVTDAATGLTYMQQRYYDPQIGRFLSADPVTASRTSGANFSRYWYANNNPYRFLDPDGRRACPTGTRICYEAPSTKKGDSQPALSEGQQQKDSNVATAQRQGRLSDGTRLNLDEPEQAFSADEAGTQAAKGEHSCKTCNGKQVHVMTFSFPIGTSPGHTHGEGIEQLPGRDDASSTSRTGQTAYMVSKTNAFAIEHTADGYRVRVVSGPGLSRAQIRELESKIETWNKHQGTGGGSCTPGC